MGLYVKRISTPIGEITIYANEQAVIGLYMGKDNHEKSVKDRFKSAEEKNTPVLKTTEKEIKAYFAGKIRKFTVPVESTGTPFQEAVWRQLGKIGYGELKTYADIAASIGKPKASRAVGGAVGRNPVSIIIPCHRVIGSDATLTGFGGGLPAKKRLLETEGHLVRHARVD
jgi:methylated-DNA-[protein]-cysteine S-methyltransferase